MVNESTGHIMLIDFDLAERIPDGAAATDETCARPALLSLLLPPLICAFFRMLLRSRPCAFGSVASRAAWASKQGRRARPQCGMH